MSKFGLPFYKSPQHRTSLSAGLHQGLQSLVEGGVPPRFLIIDDGWQNTDVDKRFRTPPTSRSMPKMKQMQVRFFSPLFLPIHRLQDRSGLSVALLLHIEHGFNVSLLTIAGCER